MTSKFYLLLYCLFKIYHTEKQRILKTMKALDINQFSYGTYCMYKYINVFGWNMCT